MKTYLLTSILALLVTAGTALKAQNRTNDYLGLPGDNLNLYAVMNLFQESETLEAFERSLNEENSRINNLDLNGDNYVDYITVTDYPQGNVHNIVLRVALSPSERQDVAVFTVEQFKDGSVQIQLIGDEALYGRNYIVEPIYDETPNPGYTGKKVNTQVVRTTYVQVATWPVVRFMYDPYYVTWHSTWNWGYYPVYWNPWRPYYYHYYYGYHYNLFPVYYRHYRHWDTPRWTHYHDYYYSSVRVYSPTVVVNINNGTYKTTYSRPETRKDGERLYTSTRSSRSATMSTSGSRRQATTVQRDQSGAIRRTEANTPRSATRSAESTSRRSAEGTQVNRSAQPSRESTGATRSATQNRNTSARPATSTQRSSEVKSTAPAQRSSATSPSSTTERKPASTASQRSATRSSSSKQAPASTPSRATKSSSGSSKSSATTTRSSSGTSDSKRNRR